MKVKERIIASVRNMDEWELNVLYGQIRILEVKKKSVSGQKALPIDRIREMTSASKSSWSKTVIEERDDR